MPTEVDVTKATEDNSTIKAMREAHDKVAEENKSLKAQLTDLERKEMDEKARLTAERDEAREKAAEADKLRAENGQFASKFETLYGHELLGVPEEKRAQVQTLTANGSWADRYEAIKSAKQLITVAAPTVIGTLSNPPGAPVVQPPAAPPPQPAPFDLEKIKQGPGQFLSQPVVGAKPPAG
jgi:protein required for attachment to host cells